MNAIIHLLSNCLHSVLYVFGHLTITSVLYVLVEYPIPD